MLFKIDTPELFEHARAGRIGSSDICTVAGLNPFETPAELALRLQGKLPPKNESTPMWLGKRLEPVVAELFEKESGDQVYKNDIAMVPEAHPWMVATPDYFTAGETYIVECKTTSAFQKDKWIDGVPDYAHCQVQWQMGIWGIPAAHVACLIGGRDFVMHKIQFASDVFEQLVELGEKFLAVVHSGELPELKAEDRDVMRALFQPDESKVISISPDLEALAARYTEEKLYSTQCNALLKGSRQKCDILEACMIELMGEASRAENDTFCITRKRSVRKAYQVKETVVEKFSVKSLVGDLSDESDPK